MKKISVVLENSEPFILCAVLIGICTAGGVLFGAARQNERHQNDVQLCQEETGVPCVLMAVPAQGIQP